MREARLQKIMAVLKQQGYAKVEELAKQLGISEVTVRRDLALLESQGFVERKRGGAFLKNLRRDIPFFVKLEERKAEKIAIAKKAVSLLKNGQVIFASGGTTVYYTIQAIDESDLYDLTIITNSITTAWATINLRKNITLVHTGGTVRENSFECIGGHTLGVAESIKADVYLLGVDGIDPVSGAFFSNFEEVVIARNVIKNSSTLVVVADSSKIGVTSPFKVCEVEEVDYLVTNPHPKLKELEKYGVKIIVS